MRVCRAIHQASRTELESEFYEQGLIDEHNIRTSECVHQSFSPARRKSDHRPLKRPSGAIQWNERQWNRLNHFVGIGTRRADSSAKSTANHRIVQLDNVGDGNRTCHVRDIMPES